MALWEPSPNICRPSPTLTAPCCSGSWKLPVSYGMPALLVDGKGLVSVLETKKHLALYPFSGQILPEMSEELGGYSWSPGTLRFSEDNPLPDSLVRRILETRLAAIRK